MPMPLPTISSTYFHRNCMSTMKRQMPKVMKNNGRKVLSRKIYNRFILGECLSKETWAKVCQSLNPCKAVARGEVGGGGAAGWVLRCELS